MRIDCMGACCSGISQSSFSNSPAGPKRVVTNTTSPGKSGVRHTGPPNGRRPTQSLAQQASTSTSPSQPVGQTESAAAAHESPIVCAFDSHTNSDIRAVVIHYKSSVSSEAYRVTSGSLSREECLPNAQGESYGVDSLLRECAVAHINDPHFNSTHTPNFPGLLNEDMPHNRSTDELPFSSLDSSKPTHHPPQTSSRSPPHPPMSGGSPTDDDKSDDGKDDLRPSLLDLVAETSLLGDQISPARIGSKSASSTNANALFSFLETVSTSSHPHPRRDGDVDAPLGSSNPLAKPQANGSCSTDGPREVSYTMGGGSGFLHHAADDHRDILLVAPLVPDVSSYSSTSTTTSGSGRPVKNTITDSPSATGGSGSGAISIDSAIPGMDDGLMNGLTELPDNFFAQLGGGGFGGGGSPGVASPPSTTDAFDEGSLFTLANRESPVHTENHNPPDADPRCTLLSWGMMDGGDGRSTWQTVDKYQEIDYSDEAFFAKMGNPLFCASGEQPGAVGGESLLDCFPAGVVEDVPTLFSLLSAEETAQFSFGGRKRVANPFGGKKSKGKLIRSVFKPDHSWRGVGKLPAVPSEAAAGSSSTAYNTKDVVNAGGGDRKGKKENPFLKYLKNDLEEEAASDLGSSSASTPAGHSLDCGAQPELDGVAHTSRDRSIATISSSEDQQASPRQQGRRARRLERWRRLQEEAEAQYRAQLEVSKQRRELAYAALREEMKRVLQNHPSVVDLARVVGLSAVGVSERQGDPNSRRVSPRILRSPTEWSPSTSMNNAAAPAPNGVDATAESSTRRCFKSPDRSVDSGGSQLLNVMFHQPLASSQNAKDLDHPDALGASLLLGSDTKPPNVLSSHNGSTTVLPPQPQEDWLAAVAKELGRHVSPHPSTNTFQISNAAALKGLTKGEAALVESVFRMCSTEDKNLLEATVREVPKEHRRLQCSVRRRNERCMWGSYHNPVAQHVADVVSEHVERVDPSSPIRGGDKPGRSPTGPRYNSIIFSGPSIAVRSTESVGDAALAKFLSAKALDGISYVPRSTSFRSGDSAPTQAFSDTPPTTASAHPTMAKFTSTKVPVVVAGIATWGRMPEHDLPDVVGVPDLQSHPSLNGTSTAGTQKKGASLDEFLSPLNSSDPRGEGGASCLSPLQAGPSMVSALSIPRPSTAGRKEDGFVRSAHRPNTAVSFKSTVTLLTSKLASDCVVSISVPTAIVTTKRRKRSQNGSSSLSANTLVQDKNTNTSQQPNQQQSVTSLFSFGSEEMETVTNLVVHPVPYIVQAHQPPGNPQLIGPTVRPLIMRHQELITAATLQSRADAYEVSTCRSPSLVENARAAGITDDDLHLLLRLASVSRATSPPLNRSGSSGCNSSAGARPVSGGKSSASIRSDSVQSIQGRGAMGGSTTSFSAQATTGPHLSGHDAAGRSAEHADCVSRLGLQFPTMDEDEFIHDHSAFRGLSEEGRRQVEGLAKGPAVGLVLVSNGGSLVMSAPDLGVSPPSKKGTQSSEDAMQHASCSSAIFQASHSRAMSVGSDTLGLVDTRKPSTAPSSSITSAPTSTSREVHPRRAEVIAAVRREKRHDARRASRTSSKADVSPTRTASKTRRNSTSPKTQETSVNTNDDIALFHIEPLVSPPTRQEGSTSSRRTATHNISFHNLSSAHTSATRLHLRQVDGVDSMCSSRLRSGSVKEDPVVVGLELLILATECLRRAERAACEGPRPAVLSLVPIGSEVESSDGMDGDEEEALIEVPLLTNTNQESNFARHLTVQKSADGNVSLVPDNTGKGGLETVGGIGMGMGGSVSRIPSK